MKKKFKILFNVVLTLISLMTFLIYSINLINNHKSINLIYYFTSESNILILIVILLFFTSFKYNKNFSYLKLIALINILVTFIVNHTILDRTEITKFNFLKTIHYQHTIIPILYTIFYFLNNNNNFIIPMKNIYIVVIHPLIYCMFFLIKGYIFKNSTYPYDFLNHEEKSFLFSGKQQGYPKLLLTILILALLFYLLACLIVFIKNKLLKIKIS